VSVSYHQGANSSLISDDRRRTTLQFGKMHRILGPLAWMFFCFSVFLRLCKSDAMRMSKCGDAKPTMTHPVSISDSQCYIMRSVSSSSAWYIAPWNVPASGSGAQLDRSRERAYGSSDNVFSSRKKHSSARRKLMSMCGSKSVQF